MQNAQEKIRQLQEEISLLKGQIKSNSREYPRTGGNRLLDHLRAEMRLKNDAALAARLSVDQPIISKIRYSTRNVSNSFILRVHEISGMPVKDIRAILEA